MGAHGLDILDEAPAAAARPAAATGLGRLDLAMWLVNRAVFVLGSLALVAAACILSYSVVLRYFFHAPTDWQDEASIFLLVGATFMFGARVQVLRGHIGIEALVGYLSPRADAVRRLIIDVLSFVFCVFFAWKSWTLTHEAWVDETVTSSAWAPPLWIPYSVMSLGFTLLTVQIALQIAGHLADRGSRP